MTESRFPTFDVMAAIDEWDEHTQAIIRKRLEPPGPPQFFTEGESATLYAAIGRLLAETDPELVGKVFAHIDTMLANGGGDGYRPESQPPDAAFWRSGLALLGEPFASQESYWQDQKLHALSETEPAFFKALLKESVSAYCAMPQVWSFMGYGGPAYPRGYVRIELGAIDPWEAKPDAE
jgi:hypothetical protein